MSPPRANSFAMNLSLLVVGLCFCLGQVMSANHETGCYGYATSELGLRGYQLESNMNSHSTCRANCLNRNFIISVLEPMRKCSCLNNVNYNELNHSKSNDDHCPSCSNRQNAEKCGTKQQDTNYYYLFQSNVDYLGCFKLRDNTFVVADYFMDADIMMYSSVTRCTLNCRQMGYDVAYIRKNKRGNGHACFCNFNSQLDFYFESTPADSCKGQCNHFKWEHCSDSNTVMSVFRVKKDCQPKFSVGSYNFQGCTGYKMTERNMGFDRERDFCATTIDPKTRSKIDWERCDGQGLYYFNLHDSASYMKYKMYFVSKNKLSRADAAEQCQTMFSAKYGRLATVRSSQEHQLLKRAIRDNFPSPKTEDTSAEKFFIGLKRLRNSQFGWLDAKNSKVKNAVFWKANFPQTYGDCGAYKLHNWVNTNCAQPQNYICEQYGYVKRPVGLAVIGKTTYTVLPYMLTFAGANNACKIRKMTLLTIKSHEELNQAVLAIRSRMLLSKTLRGGYVWLNAKYDRNAGRYRWQDKKGKNEVKYANWGYRQPQIEAYGSFGMYLHKICAAMYVTTVLQKSNFAAHSQWLGKFCKGQTQFKDKDRGRALAVCQTVNQCDAALGHCQNGGTCNQQLRGKILKVECDCPISFLGAKCEIDNPCIFRVGEPQKCWNDGKCIPDPTKPPYFICNCTRGIKTKDCTVPPNECMPDSTTCKNGATCRRFNGLEICDCKPGYFGDTCEEENPCLGEKENWAPQACNKSGTKKCVILTDDNFECECLDKVNYIQPKCNPRPPGPCYPNKCQHGGICRVVRSYPKYRCTCGPDFRGTNCEIPVCRPESCNNNAVCHVISQNLVCNCTAGYTGENCEIATKCGNVVCQNGGTCQGGICHCVPPYLGKSCLGNGTESSMKSVVLDGLRYFSSRQFISYDDAEAFCGQNGGYLAPVFTAQMNNNLHRLIYTNLDNLISSTHFWIGYRRENSNAKFKFLGNYPNLPYWYSQQQKSQFENSQQVGVQGSTMVNTKDWDCVAVKYVSSSDSVKWQNKLCNSVLMPLCISDETADLPDAADCEDKDIMAINAGIASTGIASLRSQSDNSNCVMQPEVTTNEGEDYYQ